MRASSFLQGAFGGWYKVCVWSMRSLRVALFGRFHPPSGFSFERTFFPLSHTFQNEPIGTCFSFRLGTPTIQFLSWEEVPRKLYWSDCVEWGGMCPAVISWWPTISLYFPVMRNNAIYNERLACCFWLLLCACWRCCLPLPYLLQFLRLPLVH